MIATSDVKPAATNLLALDRLAMEAFFASIGEQRFRAKQVLQWLYQRDVSDFEQMTDLSKGLRKTLAEHATVQIPKIHTQQVSKDGTVKWLIKLADGNAIETVFIPEDDRGTLCVSSQVGCGLNCTFCATARQGYNRNLDAAEIIAQVMIANRALDALGVASQEGRRPVTNVVMMGMGEPLLNMPNVVAAMNLMLDDFTYGLSRRRVTLSTAGMVPMIDQLREQCPVSLAVSLHAPTDELRDKLVPLNKKYDIATLLDACRRYVSDNSRQRITFEYVMLAGINDSPTQARQLAALLRDVPSKVNLIPFNPFDGVQFERSNTRTINHFRDILLSQNIFTITRKTRGDDIDAACGQLAGEVADRTKRSEKYQSLVVDFSK